MSVQKFALLLLCTYATAQELYDGDACNTRLNTRGECRKVKECPSASIVDLRKITKEFRRCGFENNKEIICCPELSTIITTTTDRIRPSLPPTVSEIPPRLSVGKSERACADYILRAPSSVTPHILEGEEVRQGDFPHMVALGYQKDTGLSYDCGGTLISNRYVLTAAHCIINSDRLKPSVVRVGSVNLQDNSIGSNYTVETDILHPQYNRSRSYYDLALLKLSTDVEFIGDVHPACLNTDPNDPDDNLIITGWGTTDIRRESKSNILLRANLSSVSIAECNVTFTEPTDKKRVPLGITTDQMCAMDKVGSADTCQGDSGGPLQVKRKDAFSFYTVYGVTSFGKTCGTANPAVYTRVSSYLKWIEGIVWPNEYQD